jgi:hypothetical protein
MLEYKSMNTPMETKLKLLVDTSLELVDATLYRHIIIGSLMYLCYRTVCRIGLSSLKARLKLA